MVNISKLANYYKKCLYEEAKVSAFTNLYNDDNIVVELKDDNSADLTSLKMKAQLDTNKQLLYGYLFLEGTLLDETNMYAPLIYTDCTLERDGGKLNVVPNFDTISINIPAIIQLVPNADDKDAVIQELIELDTTLPGLPDHITEIVCRHINILGRCVRIDKEKKAVILTTINKGFAGVISELSTIAAADEVFLGSAMNNDCKVFDPIIDLDDAQKKVLERACTDNLTAIAGPPGTGKSHIISAIAFNYIMNGKSVLVCSKQNSAVDVIYNKISKKSSAPFCVRTGGKEYRNAIAKQVDLILSSNADENRMSYLNERMDRYAYESDLLNNIRLLEKDYMTAIDMYRKYTVELALTKNPFKYLLVAFKKHVADKVCEKLRGNIDKLREDSNEDTPITSLAWLAFDAMVRKQMVEAKNDTLVRRSLLTFAKSLKKGGIEQLGASSKDLFKLLVDRVFPCWCTTTVDVSLSIPLIKNMFDVVIIDEASQCDIATCLPLLYRAKAAVIVGDDKQLKYISFIPTAINNANMKSAGLTPEDILNCNYRECSMFDYATFMSDHGSIMLTEQYRGNPAIMEFSNQAFYHGCVANHGQVVAKEPIKVITKVDGEVAKDKTINNVEIDEVLHQVYEIIRTDNESDTGTIRTIGILSPFKDQVKAIEKAILRTFTMTDIEKHNILVGTAHSFQGEERDVMILSWTVSRHSPVQQHTFINNPNLFNVAITRADKEVINIVSTQKELRGLLKEYIEYCEGIINGQG